MKQNIAVEMFQDLPHDVTHIKGLSVKKLYPIVQGQKRHYFDQSLKKKRKPDRNR